MKNTSNRVFIVAEAGSNWKVGSKRADWKRASQLVRVARDAGADAVKFQTFRPESVYVPNAGTSDYLSRRGIRRPIVEIFRELAMPYEMLLKLAFYAKRCGLEFMSSFFSPEDFRWVDSCVKRHKIASYEITHFELIALAARSGKPLFLSTGASNFEEIDLAVKHFHKNGGKELVVLQCTASYPAPMETLNLRVIPILAKRYHGPAGLSDHSMDPVIAPVAAVAIGASVIEKHFTLDRRFLGPDHAFAIEPKELALMVRAVRDCERTLGDGRKHVLPQEKELHGYAQRAVQATRPILVGEVLHEGFNMAILRPGRRKKGMHPRWLRLAEGKRARRAIALGDGVGRRDW